jgi:hypothetical protein
MHHKTGIKYLHDLLRQLNVFGKVGKIAGYATLSEPIFRIKR